MPTECSRDLFGYEVVEGRQVVAAFDGGEVTSDAGALLLGAADRALGLVRRLAGCFTDGRAAHPTRACFQHLWLQSNYRRQFSASAACAARARGWTSPDFSN